MFNSNVLEVGIGLIFTFLTVSLVAGALTETWATMLSWRSNSLLEGIKQLVNDPNFNGLARDLYNHALVHPRGGGGAVTEADLGQKPSYIDPQHFAQAVLDSVAAGRTTMAGIQSAVAGMADGQIKTMLGGIVTHAEDDIGRLRQGVANWFDSAMDRLSGDYKRRTQYWAFGIGFVVAVGLNIDTLHVASLLWQNPEAVKNLAIGNDLLVRKYVEDMMSLGLPIGWPSDSWQTLPGAICSPAFWLAGLSHLPGWLLTAGSTLFGTSFWYDTLSTVLKLRGSGPPPAKQPS